MSKREPLYPHVPKSKREPLYPHVKSTKGVAETVTPEVTKLTGDIWNTMTPVERENLRVKALAASSFTDPTSLNVSKHWDEYWGKEKRALIREFKKEQEASLTEAKGKEIASKTGAIYRGIQKGIGTMPDMYVFIEPVTGTSFMARTKKEVEDKLIEKRRLFKKYEKGGE